MPHEMNIGDVRRWRGVESRRSASFSSAEITRWNDSRHGMITQEVRGSHVDIYVRLERAAARLWWPLVFTVGLGVVWMAGKIAEAFITGRVHEILMNATRAGH
jgi:hypothetical protein